MLEQYPAEVKLVYKYGPMPDHSLSRSAAIAAMAAGEQKKYWEYHDKIMQNMSTLSTESFDKFARELGLDMDAFQKSLTDPKHEKHLEKDVQDAINADVQVRPAVFVNGRIVNIRNPEGFKAIISEELQKKKK